MRTWRRSDRRVRIFNRPRPSRRFGYLGVEYSPQVRRARTSPPAGPERQREAEETYQSSDEELTPPHSMMRSARARNDGGIVRPRALAVLRLIISSNFVGCSTGRSAGLAPFRILST